MEQLRIVNLNKSGPNYILENQQGRNSPGEVSNAARILHDRMGFDIQLTWNNEVPKSLLLGKLNGLVFRVLGFPLTLNNLRFIVGKSHGRDIVCANADTWMYQLGAVRAFGGLRNMRAIAVSYGLAERLQEKRPLQRALAINVLNKLDAIVVHSKVELKDLQTLGLSKIAYIAYGVDTSFWKPMRSFSDGNLIFSPGTHPRRDWGTLIRACGYPLTLAGTKSSVEMRGLPRNVQVVKFAYGDYSIVQSLFNQAKCVMVPLQQSRAIAGEATVLQAMAMQRPVIVTKTQGSSPDIIRNGETCFGVPAGDISALRDALTRVWRGGQQVDAIARRGQEIVFERFNAERYASDWANFYHSL